MEEVTDEYEEQGRFDSISIEPIPTRNNRLSGSAASNISIESFQIIEERVRKHVAYKITGEENNAKFEVSRRYKEFRILHRILSQLWPGCYIPKIPKKKAVVKFM